MVGGEGAEVEVVWVRLEKNARVRPLGSARSPRGYGPSSKNTRKASCHHPPSGGFQTRAVPPPKGCFVTLWKTWLWQGLGSYYIYIHFINFKVIMRALPIFSILKRCFIWKKLKGANTGRVEAEWGCESGESTLSFLA